MSAEYNSSCISQQPMLFAPYNGRCHALPMDLRSRIAAAMRHSGDTQDSLAKRVGISQQAIGKLLSGKSQTSRRLTEIALACGVRPEWLAAGEGEMLPSGRNPPESHSAGLIRDTMAAAVTIARRVQDMAIEPIEGERFIRLLTEAALIYQELGSGQTLSGTSLDEAAREVAARLRSTG
ncbi:helix-turn-helix domain-containing protein [Xanthomonas sp. CFBP 7912]|uniref:helix-turn-helix domain-containing protein n=1 Tax=Xanthomonas sp. CFBP 7912 TaxID=1891621 RepID=UPI00130482F8|nr:helix-turn-helix domain-containing protein [Xanthomonas sp. CFBP 7912]